MPRSTITGNQIRDGGVQTVDLGTGKVTTEKIADSAAATVRIEDGTVTNAKFSLREITTAKLADAYVLDGDAVDVGGTTLLTHPTLSVETFHIAVTSSEAAPSASTDGIPLDGASHVTWALVEGSFTSASYQGWVYTTNLGWIQIPKVAGPYLNGDSLCGSLEVAGAERFSIQMDTLTGGSLLKILKAVTT